MEEITEEKSKISSELISITSEEPISSKLALSNENILKMENIFNEVSNTSQNCTQLINKLKDQIKNENNGEGISFLNMKNHLLLDYLINLALILLVKVSGKSIENKPQLHSLVEIRTFLEKIRPIDQKLKYQIDKLVKAFVEGEDDSNDPLKFKANLDDLDRGVDSSESEEDEDEDIPKKESKPDDVYRPPKVAPQYFEDEEDATLHRAEKVKRKSINRTLIRELQEEFLDTPVEVHNMGDAYSKQISKETLERQRYEETYMTRLPVTKQDKHKESRVSTVGILGEELTTFSKKRSNEYSNSSSKAKKSKHGRKKGGKKFFRK